MMEKIIQDLQNVLDAAVASGEECGCQLTVYRHGRLLCDLAAGAAGADGKTPMTVHSLVPVFSVGKGVMATLLHMFAERGALSYTDKICRYWPEFAQNGKENIEVWHLLTHRAGLYAFPEGFAYEDCFNWKKATAAMAAMAPLGPVGGIHRYHANTFGLLVGRLLEGVTGRALPEILQTEIFAPLGLHNIYFGVPEKRLPDVVSIVSCGNDGDPRLRINSPAILQGLNPSSNGVSNAHSLARIYAALLPGGVDGVQLLRPETLDKVLVVCRAPEDPVGSECDKFGLGYVLCGPAAPWSRMFGHAGACGAEGFADRETGYAVGFTKNKLNATHPEHPTRDAISEVLGIPRRVW